VNCEAYEVYDEAYDEVVNCEAYEAYEAYEEAYEVK
jgi:hypothetical protein